MQFSTSRTNEKSKDNSERQTFVTEFLQNVQGEKKPKQSDLYDIVGKIIDVVVKIVGIVPFTLARILENFIGQDKPGIKALAAALLIGGVLLSADGFFQAFGGKPLFPWWEESWIGWAWLWVWTKVNFWAAIIVALAVLWVESKALRGKKPDQAKADYDQIKHHQTPAKNHNAIDLVEVRRLQYKRSGINERSVLGAFILAVFVLDFAATFIFSRNPWGLSPTEFVGVCLYNFCSMIAGETGYVFWKKENEYY